MAAVSGTLLSTSWYRVAGLRPRLRTHARLHRHRYQDEVWHLLQDRASGRVHRFTPSARLILALLDGKRTVAEAWEMARQRQGERAPTQDEMIELLGQLHAADLLHTDVTPDVAELFARGRREERAQQLRAWTNPMAIRLPLFDPDAVLNHLHGLTRFIWSAWGAALWLLVVLPALALVPPHWSELSNNFSDRILAADNLAVLFLVFPALKALHELGHATAIKAGGGEVHDLGIMLLLLLPVPYVDAAAVTAFDSKYWRALVGVAGVAVEIFVAALAFYAWLLAEPGPFRAVLFNIMTIAGVSTLVFNGNPLLRYDAYYVLADLVEIPNLAQRSSRYWGYVVQRYLLRVRRVERMVVLPRERIWFLCYGAAALVYRIGITLVIALFIATRFFIFGVLLALWSVVATLVLPLVRALRFVVAGPELRGQRLRTGVVAVALVASVLTLLVGVNVPHFTHAEGIVWLPEQALVRARAGGFLEAFLTRPGDEVGENTPLVRSVDPSLAAQVQRVAARVAELKISHATEVLNDRANAEVEWEKLQQEQANLAALQERSGDLVVRARMPGRFVVPQSGDQAGRFFRQGDLIGYVIGAAPPMVRVVVPQDAVDRVRDARERVRVMLSGPDGAVLEGRIGREVPGGDEYLPSRALAVEGGGEIVTDPRDPHGGKALQRMFQFDVTLPETTRFAQFGQRAFVRFEHAPEPLAQQWYRSLRLLFLSHFNV